MRYGSPIYPFGPLSWQLNCNRMPKDRAPELLGMWRSQLERKIPGMIWWPVFFKWKWRVSPGSWIFSIYLSTLLSQIKLELEIYQEIAQTLQFNGDISFFLFFSLFHFPLFYLSILICQLNRNLFLLLQWNSSTFWTEIYSSRSSFSFSNYILMHLIFNIIFLFQVFI